MDVTSIINSILSIGGLGLVFGAGLGYAGKVLAVEEDPKLGEILDALPGANCGGCGFPGCGGLATAILEGNAPVTACPVGGAAVAAAVAAVMGVVAEEKDPTVAFIRCGGDCEKAKDKYDYFGIDDCTMASQLVNAGSKSCSHGCLGLGSCYKACDFGAISLVDGIAVIDDEKCVSCGKCVATCPKKLIEILPKNNAIRVKCSSKDIGKVVMANCSVGCIACKICEKTCKFDAVHIIDNIAIIDYEKCKKCKMCANKCPKKVITGFKPVDPNAPKKEAPKPAPKKEEVKPADTKPADTKAGDTTEMPKE